MSFDPLCSLTSRTLVLPADNIDTDQIIPARFLTTTAREGLGRAAFHDWRFDADGASIASSPLNAPSATEARILVAGNNFGCGSSREHAPWALHDFGFRAVLSTDIADIFLGNALKNGLMAIEIDPETHRYLLDTPGVEITIDLEASVIRLSNGRAASFAMEPFARRRLLDGGDDLGALLSLDEPITAFELARVV